MSSIDVQTLSARPVVVGFLGESTREGRQHWERLLVSPEYQVRTGAASQILAAPDVELVWVTLTAPERAAAALRAIEAGKHVVVELPLAFTVADVDELLAAAEARQRAVIVSHPGLWDEDFRLAHHVVQAGTCGWLEIVSLSLWQRYPGAVLDPLRDQLTVVFIAQLLTLVGDLPAAVTCHRPRTSMHEGGLLLTVQFAAGTVGVLQTHTAAFPPVDTGWTITGSTGGYAHRMQYVAASDGEIIDEPVQLDSAHDDPATTYYTAIARHVRGEGMNPAPAVAQRGLAAVLEAAAESLAAGATIRLKHTRLEPGDGSFGR